MSGVVRNGRAAWIAVWGTAILFAGKGMITTGLATVLPQEWDVDYRFIPSTLQVSESLPVGTVMATTVIPVDVMGHYGVRKGELWHSAGQRGSAITISSNLSGVGIHMVLEPESGIDEAAMFTLLTGRHEWRMLPPVSRGSVLVELVKTGPMRPGTVSSVTFDVQYREPLQKGTRVQMSRIMHLHYAGILSIGILHEGRCDTSHRLS